MRWALFFVACSALAQDPFEIHVYEYEKLKPLEFTLEQHLNYWAMGLKMPDGTLAPTNDQLHLTHELTAGITDHISIGFMQLNGVIPGTGFQYGGWRVLPHFYAPESWGLPVDVGLVVEVSFARPQFEADTAHVEIRPIVEKKIGDWQIDFNPVVTRVVRGAVSEGWQFEPAARVAYGEEDRRVRPYVEWYSEVTGRQVHLIYPGVDVRVAKNLVWSVGIGAGLTSQEPRMVVKSHLEFTFGRGS